MDTTVKLIDPTTINPADYKGCYVGCVVLTHDHQILLQYRGHDFASYSNYIAEFGGHIETDEQPMQALIRELHEELGAKVDAAEVISFGAVVEPSSNNTELLYCYFWHDKHHTITGCYEGSPRYFEHAAEVLTQANITDGLRWLLGECQKRQLIK